MRLTGIPRKKHPVTGLRVDLDRPRLSRAEADQVAGYLLSGSPVVEPIGARVLLTDEVSGEPRRVPIGSRTDGEWIWQDNLTYYVKEHCLSPREDFLTYIRGLNYVLARPVTEDDLRAASAFMSQ